MTYARMLFSLTVLMFTNSSAMQNASVFLAVSGVDDLATSRYAQPLDDSSVQESFVRAAQALKQEEDPIRKRAAATIIMAYAPVLSKANLNNAVSVPEIQKLAEEFLLSGLMFKNVPQEARLKCLKEAFLASVAKLSSEHPFERHFCAVLVEAHGSLLDIFNVPMVDGVSVKEARNRAFTIRQCQVVAHAQQ